MVPALVLVAMFVLAALSDRTGRAGAAALAAVSVLWLLVNTPMEGAILLSVTTNHGLTAGDLVGLAGLGIAGWRFRTAGRRR